MLQTVDIFTGVMAPRHLTAVCFMLAMVAALLARRRILALFMAAGAIESYALMRFEFHNLVRGWIAALFPGESHFALQTVAFAIAAIVALVLLTILARRATFATSADRIIALGCAMVIGMLGIEQISRDDIEAIAYTPVGPFALFHICIAAGALLIAAGCLKEAGAVRRARTDRSSV